MTHEYPFLLIEYKTGVSWESIQAPWHRFTMTLCILQTLKEKFRSGNSRDSHASQHNKSKASRFEASGPKGITAASPTVTDIRRPSPTKARGGYKPQRLASQTTSTGFSFRNLVRQGTTSPAAVSAQPTTLG